MIPENIIVDKNMILRYLLTNNINPFNRLKLDIEILKSYNNRHDIILKINNFKIKLEKYKKENNILE